MLNSLLYLSTECQNQNTFGLNVNTKGTFAVILGNALTAIAKEKNVQFIITKKGNIDELFIIKNNNKQKVCNINGYSSVNKIKLAIDKII